MTDSVCRTFNVAGHRFSISLPGTADTDTVLRPYIPFLDTDGECRLLFTLESGSQDSWSGNCGTLAGCFNEEAPFIWIYRGCEPLVFGFSLTRDKPDFLLTITPDFRRGHMLLPGNCTDSLLQFAVNNSSMLMYMLATAQLDTLLIHASVVEYKNGGYAFTGKSGSGKSTHSRLWLKNIEGCSLLNDDNPVIRVTGGKAVVYGSPWSGKTPCWKNRNTCLRAVVHIFQAPENRIERLKGIQAYASFITSCSSMKWDRRVSDGINRTVEQLLSTCGFYNLYCLPDREAALTCCSVVTPAEEH